MEGEGYSRDWEACKEGQGYGRDWEDCKEGEGYGRDCRIYKDVCVCGRGWNDWTLQGYK